MPWECFRGDDGHDRVLGQLISLKFCCLPRRSRLTRGSAGGVKMGSRRKLREIRHLNFVRLVSGVRSSISLKT